MPGTFSGKLGGATICRSLESWVELRAVDRTDTAKTARVSYSFTKPSSVPIKQIRFWVTVLATG